jgi:hypothetical protein
MGKVTRFLKKMNIPKASGITLISLFQLSILLSCSLLPAQKQGGIRTREAKISVSRSILDAYAELYPEIKRSYKTLSANLDTLEFNETERLLSDVDKRDASLEERAKIAASSFQICVNLLPSKRADSSRFFERLKDVRTVAGFYRVSLIEKIAGTDLTSEQPLASSLALDTVDSLDVTAKTEKMVKFLASAARGTGFQSAAVQNRSAEQEKIANQIEEQIKIVQANLFLKVVLSARDASLKVGEVRNIVDEKVLDEISLTVALQAVSLSKLITTEVNTGRIEENAVDNVIKDWTGTLTQSVTQTIGEPAKAVVSLPPIPDTIPSLSTEDGRFSGALGEWQYRVETSPSVGTLDITQNPPKYAPSVAFLNTDLYAIRLCHSTYKFLCSNEFRNVVSRPIVQNTVRIETSASGFLPGSSATCFVAPTPGLVYFYRWYYQENTNSAAVQLSDSSSGTLANSSFPRGSKVWCDVSALGNYGLLSAPVAGDPVAVPNSAPALAEMGVSSVEANENADKQISLGKFNDVDGDLLSWVLVLPPTKGDVTGWQTNVSSEVAGSVVYRPRGNESGPDSFSYKVCDNQQQQACSAPRVVNILVNAVDDPTTISLNFSAPLSVAEDSPSGPLSFSVSDADSPVSCSLVSAESSQTSLIANSSLIVLGGSSNSCSLSFLPAINQSGQSTITLSIRVNNVLIASNSFEVVVTPDNDAPTNIQISHSSIAENQTSHRNVGVLSTSDVDVSDPHTYSLVSGTGDTDNAAFNISGSTLRMTALADFETKSSYSVRVRSTDTGGLFVENSFTITVTDANEEPTSISLTNSSVPENNGANTTVGTLSTVDVDAGSSFTYSLVSGTGDTDNAAFNISGSTLRMTAAADFETKSSYSVRVRSTDAGGLFTENTFTISITNQNEAPTSVSLSNSSLSENAGANATVGTLSASDVDSGDTQTYTLVSGTGSDDNTSFNISGTTLQMSASADFESKSSYSVRVRSTDAGGLFTENTFTISITNQNEAPTSVSLSNSSLSENAGANATVGTLSSVDVDASSSFTYTLVTGTGDTDNAAFNISGSTVRMTASADFETKSSYSVRVRSTDADGLFTESSFAITITDQNEAPTNINLSGSSLAENASVNSVVGALSSTDADTSQTFTYTLVAGCGGNNTGNGSFNINESQLRSSASFDYEAQNSYTVCVRTTDGDNLSYDKSFVIGVSNANDAPTSINGGSATASVGEDGTVNIALGASTDQDVVSSGQALNFEIVSGPSHGTLGTLPAVPTSGTANVSYSPALNYNGSDSLSYRVCDDNASNSCTAAVTVTLTVTPVNDSPTMSVISSPQITSQDSSKLINVSVDDVDGPLSCTSSYLSYSSSSPSIVASSGAVVWSGTWPACTATVSPVPGAVGSSDLTFTVFDGASSASRTFALTVTNQNDSPTDIQLSNSSLAENAGSNATVGSLSTVDPDALDSHTYTLVSGTGDTDNAAFNISGSTLRMTASADFETKSSYSVRVRSTDAGGLFTENTFTLSITNQNEAPTSVSLSNSSLSENAGANATLGTLSTVDVDAGSTFTYTLVSGTGSSDNASFNISGAVLQMTASADFETKSSYSVRVRSTDAGGLFAENTLTISITNQNEAPTLVSLSNSSLSENAGANAAVGTLSSVDVDASSSFTYTLVTGTGDTDNAAFNISSSTLRMSASADFETKSSYSVRVRSTDAGGLFTENTFTLSVTNQNEAPTSVSLSNSSLSENAGANATVGTLSSVDVDAGSTFTYTLVTGTGDTDNAAFNISSSTLRMTASADFETKSSYSVRVRSTDAGGLFVENNFAITIINANEGPTSVSLVGSSLDENAGDNATVGLLTAVDVDYSDTQTYTLVSGTGSTDNSSFNILGSTLRMNVSADFESKSSYSVRVRSTDAGGLFVENSFTITINNVNEVPTNITLSASSLAENAGANATVGTFSTVDPDAGSTFTYTLVSGAGDTDNAAFNVSSSTLRMTASADFESKSTYSVRVRSTDAGGLFTEKNFTVSITNVNDAPTSVSLSNASLAETAGADATVGTLSTIDPDASSTFTYTLVTGTGSTDNASFNISGSNLRMTASADFETKSSYSVRVRSTDGDGLFVENTFTVSITNVNESPAMDAIANQSVNMNSTVAVPFVVGDVDGALSCSSSHLSYSSSSTSIVASSNAVSWSGTWPNCVGTVTPVNNAFGSVNLTFQINDGTLSANRTFTLTVNDTRLATAPTVSGSARSYTNASPITISGTCTSGYQVRWVENGTVGAITTCSANGDYSFNITRTIAPSTVVEYTFAVYQQNLLNPTWVGPVLQTWVVDSQVPAPVVITSPTINPTISNTGTFNFLGTCEAGGTVLLSATVNPNTITAPTGSTTCSDTGTFNISQSLTVNGTYTYSITQRDLAGNTSSAANFTWTLDSTLPNTPSFTAPTTITNGIYYTNASNPLTTITITVTCTSTYLVTILENGAAVVTAQACPGTSYSYTTTTHSSNGSYQFQAYQEHPTAGTLSATASFTWVRDTAVPAAPVIQNPATTSITTPNSLYLSGTCETNATVFIYINAVTPAEQSLVCQNGVFATQVTRTVATSYSVTTKQQDAAGNLSAASTAVTWTVDPNSVPVPTVTSPTNGTTTTNTSSLTISGICQPDYQLTISAGASTTLATSEVLVPSGSYTQTCSSGGTFLYTVSKSTDQIHRFNITQTYQGVNSSAAQVTWTRDTAAPTVTLTAGAGNPYSGTAVFTFTASESGSTFQCSVDNEVTYNSCTSPYVYTFASTTSPSTSTDVQRKLFVKATDSALNTGAATLNTWTPKIFNTALLYQFNNDIVNTSSYYGNGFTAPSLNLSGTSANLATAVFSQGRTFSNTTNTLADNALLSSYLSNATFDFWIGLDKNAVAGTILSQAGAFSINLAATAGGNPKFYITFSATTTNGTSNSAIGTSTNCTLAKSNNTTPNWTYVMVTFNAGSANVYCQRTSGGSNMQNSGTGTWGSRMTDSSSALTVGGTGAFYIDALRISQAVRAVPPTAPAAAPLVD